MLLQKELVAALELGPCQGRGWLLGIDGEQRSGKSSLAKILATQLNASVVSCDDFIRNGRLTYPEALDLAALSERLTNAQAQHESIIIESVMLQLILQAVNAELVAVIYVRHTWPIGTQTHPYLFDKLLLSQAIDQEREIDRMFFRSDDSPSLAGEILHYHMQYEPHITSKYLFERSFSNGC